MVSDGFCLVVVIDWCIKKIVGHCSGLQAKADHCFEILDIAVNRQLSNSVREQNLKLMSDNGF